MSRITERKSNFELLRIFAMLMIVGSHFAVHGVQHVLDLENAYKVWADGTFINKFITSLFPPGGALGVSLFFMLTGYFLVGKMKTSVLKVCLQTIFYGIFIAIFLIANLLLYKFFGFGYAFSELTVVQKVFTVFRNIFVPISSSAWWFVSAYVLLVLVAPFINQFLAKLNKSGFIFLLIVTWFFWYSCQYIVNSAYFSLGRAFFFYSLGAFYKKYIEHKGAKLSYLLLVIVFWILYSLIEYFFAGKVGKNTASAFLAFLKVTAEGTKLCFLIPVMAWCLFTFFARLEIKSSCFINTLAATTFGVYLIHDSGIGRNLIWNRILKVSEVQFKSEYFPLIAIFDVLAVFAACSILDFVRLKFFEPKMLASANKMLVKFKENYSIESNS